MLDVETHLNTLQEMLDCQEFVYPSWKLMGKKHGTYSYDCIYS